MKQQPQTIKISNPPGSDEMPTVESENCCICGRSVKDQRFAHLSGTEGWVSLCSASCTTKYLDQSTPPNGHKTQYSNTWGTGL